MQTLKFDQKTSFHDIIIANEPLCASFIEYLACIHALEAFTFWLEVELFKRMTVQDDCFKTSKLIVATYINSQSPTEINLEGKIRREVVENFANNPNDTQLFNKAQEEVELTLKYDCLRVFLDVNKGKVPRKSVEVKKSAKESETRALLIRYYTQTKLDSKKQRKPSFSKSKSGSFRKISADQPKITSAMKSRSFGEKPRDLKDFDAKEGVGSGGNEAETPLKPPKRIRGKKIRMDESRKWALSLSMNESIAPKEEENEYQNQNQNQIQDQNQNKNQIESQIENQNQNGNANSIETKKVEEITGVEDSWVEKGVSSSSENLISILKIGSKESKKAEKEEVVRESDEVKKIDKKGSTLERRRLGGIRFMCFGM